MLITDQYFQSLRALQGSSDKGAGAMTPAVSQVKDMPPEVLLWTQRKHGVLSGIMFIVIPKEEIAAAVKPREFSPLTLCH